jgi:hypothetical protein
MASPAHIELIGEEKNEEIKKEEEVKSLRQTKKQIAQARAKAVKVGGAK